jgi:hypothetical protein
MSSLASYKSNLQQVFVERGVYRHVIVAVKRINKQHVVITRKLKKDLKAVNHKELAEIKSENVLSLTNPQLVGKGHKTSNPS